MRIQMQLRLVEAARPGVFAGLPDWDGERGVRDDRRCAPCLATRRRVHILLLWLLEDFVTAYAPPYHMAFAGDLLRAKGKGINIANQGSCTLDSCLPLLRGHSRR
jgi:hypothetical protein